MTVSEKAKVDSDQEIEDKRRMTDELGDVDSLERQQFRYILGELNILRVQAGLSQRTFAEAEKAIQDGRGA